MEDNRGPQSGPNSGKTKLGSSPPLLSSPPKSFTILAGEIQICSISSHRGGLFSVLKCLGVLLVELKSVLTLVFQEEPKPSDILSSVKQSCC